MSSELKIVPSYEAAIAIVAKYITEKSGGKPIEILEAGCGRKWEFPALEIPYRLTGIDLDYDALQYRKTQQADLDDTIYGDLRTVSIKDNSFDIIYSSFVLEHIDGADVVLDNFARWLRDSGLVIITIPDRDSLYGLLTRLTPHWFHILVYRYVYHNKMAGKPGHGPYPTIYDKAISRKRMLAFAKANDLEVKEQCAYLNYLSRRLVPFSGVVSFITLGRLRSDYSDSIYIFQKQPRPS